jgi:hypothetical protein
MIKSLGFPGRSATAPSLSAPVTLRGLSPPKRMGETMDPMIRKPVTVGGAVLAVVFAAVIGTILVLAQALVRIVARRRAS